MGIYLADMGNVVGLTTLNKKARKAVGSEVRSAIIYFIQALTISLEMNI
jgi:hypothetical protein